MEDNINRRFKGHEKHLIHFLAPYERGFLKAALPRVPSYISTAHLTLMTILWSLTIVVSGFLARGNLAWLWLFSAAIILQYITDMLDGAVGRQRNSGLIKWGFYMDHFLDYMFMSSIVIGYAFLLPASDRFLALLCLAVMSGYMVHTFMDFAITNNFKISCNQFGVSEARIVLVAFNVALMIWGPGLLAAILPFVVAAAFVGLCILVSSAQKTYQHLDTLLQAQKDESIQGKDHAKPLAKVF